MLCRKKQELLSKTGQWINKTTDGDGMMRPNMSGVSYIFANSHTKSQNIHNLHSFAYMAYQIKTVTSSGSA